MRITLDIPDEYAKVFLDEIKHTLKFIDIDIGWDKEKCQKH